MSVKQIDPFGDAWAANVADRTLASIGEPDLAAVRSLETDLVIAIDEVFTKHRSVSMPMRLLALGNAVVRLEHRAACYMVEWNQFFSGLPTSSLGALENVVRKTVNRAIARSRKAADEKMNGTRS